MPTPERHETPAQRSDRNWNELLQELRVTQTGIQVMSGFLLTVPFSARFDRLSDNQRALYLVSLCLSLLATLLLVAPVSSHRILFRKHEKAALVENAHTMARAGLVVFGAAMLAVAALVFSVVVSTAAAIVVAAAGLVAAVLAWVVLPLVSARRY
ncbi:sodium:proton antiporter [Flexivirga sp. ID2601S]|uniref:Sodium:proton antiporter n=1 Tax=Flexivirga aerilata TaxID=1656889 RepID=A0A849AAX7_9MICO|nr:DUF6328 family protein [Flexivirga aerilata]NNG38074.1 sodium:proton antiporter [Flexivirga aerilata]